MKIGFFTTTYLPISYGSVTSIESFRRGLESDGHQVFVFTPRFWGYEDIKERVFRTPSLMYGYKIKYPLAIPVWRAMHKEIDTLGLDLIHCHQPFSLCQAAMKHGKKRRIPVIFTYHCKYEEYVHYIPPFLPRTLIADYTKKTATNFANNSDYVLTPSDSIKKLIESRGVVSPIRTLSTGVDWQSFQQVDKIQARKKLGISQDEKVLVSCGRVDREKNIMFLAESLFPLLKKNKNIKLIFVGEGALKKVVGEFAKKEGVEKQVVLVGFVNQDLVRDYYAAGDIFVQTSLTETQGMSLLEAMAGGLAVVAIRASGSVDQIEEGKTGVLVSEDKRLFRNEVEKLSNDSELRLKLGQAAKQYAKTCDSSIRVRELENVYEKILRKT